MTEEQATTRMHTLIRRARDSHHDNCLFDTWTTCTEIPRTPDNTFSIPETSHRIRLPDGIKHPAFFVKADVREDSQYGTMVCVCFAIPDADGPEGLSLQQHNMWHGQGLISTRSTMTVSDLVARLQNLPPGHLVFVQDREGDPRPVLHVTQTQTFAIRGHVEPAEKPAEGEPEGKRGTKTHEIHEATLADLKAKAREQGARKLLESMEVANADEALALLREAREARAQREADEQAKTAAAAAERAAAERPARTHRPDGTFASAEEAERAQALAEAPAGREAAEQAAIQAAQDAEASRLEMGLQVLAIRKGVHPDNAEFVADRVMRAAIAAGDEEFDEGAHIEAMLRLTPALRAEVDVPATTGTGSGKPAAPSAAAATAATAAGAAKVSTLDMDNDQYAAWKRRLGLR